ncbi:MAG TPA: ankyrin repeat domain-containing protein [Bacteroidales bacterium]|jgi:hypothetical protein|nr:ankyrin repeat domain-containing protein [Bacteroidales bacterium]
MAKKEKIRISAQSAEILQESKLTSLAGNESGLKPNIYLQPKTKEEIDSVIQKLEVLKNPFEIEKAFYDGVSDRNTSGVIQAIKSGFDVNNTSDDGCIPIIYAAAWDNPEALKLLIESGAVLTQELIDKLYDIAIFQVCPRTYDISRTLAEMNLKPSLKYLGKISERMGQFIIEAWGNYISTQLLKVFPVEGITKPVNLTYKDFSEIHNRLVDKIKETTTLFDGI